MEAKPVNQNRAFACSIMRIGTYKKRAKVVGPVNGKVDQYKGGSSTPFFKEILVRNQIILG